VLEQVVGWVLRDVLLNVLCFLTVHTINLWIEQLMEKIGAGTLEIKTLSRWLSGLASRGAAMVALHAVHVTSAAVVGAYSNFISYVQWLIDEELGSKRSHGRRKQLHIFLTKLQSRTEARQGWRGSRPRSM
jgi:hypothetical protein